MSVSVPAASRGSARGTLRARRERAVALGLAAVGGLILLFAAGRVWAIAVLHQPPPLPDRRVPVRGVDLSGFLRALALLALAGVPALVALKGWGRLAIGVVLSLVGLGAVVAVLTGAGADAVRGADVVASQLDTGGVVSVTGRTGWPIGYLLGALAVAAAGGLTVARCRYWPSLGARYDSPTGGAGARPVSGDDRRAGDPWAALDRGEDPTLT